MPKLLGKLPARHDSRTLKLSDYITPSLPAIPDSFSWIDKDQIQEWGQMCNDRYGDCVWAALGHLIMSWTASNGSLYIPSDQEILQAYASTGFNPVTGANDNGTNELDALKYMQKTGIAGHKIGAFVSVNLHSPEEIKAAIYLFGGILMGVGLPEAAEGQPAWNYPFPENDKRDESPGSWGGHGIPALAFSDNDFKIITWGEPLSVNADFFNIYMDEGYAIISPDFVDGTRPAPNGFNMDQLIADLQAVTS